MSGFGIRIAALSGLLLASGLAARADDFGLPSETGIVAWQGGYVGAHGGMGLGTAGDLSTGGTVIGLHGGYNFQSQRLVAGGEAALTASQIGNSATSEHFDQNLLATGRARLGFAYGNLLTYGVGGIAFGTTRYVNAYSTDVGKFGWTLGGGVEAMIMPHVVLRGEFEHLELSESTYLNSSAQSVTMMPKSNILQVGLSYKF